MGIGFWEDSVRRYVYNSHKRILFKASVDYLRILKGIGLRERCRAERGGRSSKL